MHGGATRYGPARRGLFTRDGLRNTCTTPATLIAGRESLEACGTSVYLQAAACKCVCTAATLCCGRARCGSLHFTCAAALRTGDNGARREQWRERDTARETLRKAAANFAIGITYVPRGILVGGVVDAERDVLFASWENGRFVSPENSVRRGFTLLTGRGYFIVSRKGTRNALRGTTLLISSLARLVSRR